MSEINTWWGEFSFSLNEVKCWRIGERCIAIKRSEHEWTVWDQTTPTEINKPIKVSKPKVKETFADVKFERFTLAQTTEKLVIEPSLADRAMVVRPSKSITVMPGEKVTLFVSTPIWMTIMRDGHDTPMADIPFWRPSDSWFGPSTMKGDMCYSKYTDARMDINLIEKRAHRAITCVTLINDQKEYLHIHRLNLPVPSLRVYVNDNGEFWTDQVNILQTQEHSKSVSDVSQSPPELAQTMQLVSESREQSKKPSFMSSIKSLIG